MTQSGPPLGREPELPVEVVWLTPPGGPAGGAPSPPDRSDRRRVIVVAVAGSLLVAALLTVLVIQLTRADDTAADTAADPAASTAAASEPVSTGSAPVAPSSSDPVGPSPTTATEPVDPGPSTAPPRRRQLTDPPSRDGRDARVIAGGRSTPCRALNQPAAYGDYPAARCTFFETASGRLTGERISAGEGPRNESKKVACQRNLRIDNPEFNSGQTNTWWVWVRSDDGSYDWFPETAIVEGASDRPLGAVAVCR